MQAHMDSKEPLIRRPFDLQETVVLLDVYLSTVKKGVPMANAAEAASLRLRSLAERNGYAKGTIRISLGKANTEENVEAIFKALAKIFLA